MARIPTGFKPIISDYRHGGPGGVMRTEVEGGMPRYALDYDRGSQQFQVTLMLTKLQYQVWSYFFHNTVKKGAISFDMPLDSGMGLSDHAVNIIPDSYQASHSRGTIVTVSFGVEAESQAYTDPEAGEALLELYEIYGTGLNALLAALEKFATVDSLVLDF